MARARKTNGNGQKGNARQFRFTVIYLPVREESEIDSGSAKSRVRKITRANPPRITGYQVTVPLLPGLITFGRTLPEAREMAEDAIRVHIEGLKKAGERIPDERSAQTEQLRVPISA